MADQARQQVSACEKEISAIKAQLRSISEDESASTTNRLVVQWTQHQGLPDTAQPRLELQLSSPIEQANLDALEAKAEFEGVELGQATLTVTVHDADVDLGTSTAYDLASLLSVNAMEAVSEVTHELEVKIGDDVCTATLQLIYHPTAQDYKEELYELLTKATERKTQAVEALRQIALQSARQNQQSQQVAVNQPAVRKGFLNKTATPEKKQSKLVQWYQRHLGPNSRVRRVWPVAKNYVLFVGAVGWMHVYGQAMALPRPV